MATPAGGEVLGALAVIARGVADTAGPVPVDVVRGGGHAPVERQHRNRA